MPEIVKWRDIKDDFKDALLVGNGGSIALSPNFSYSSLYSYAVKNKLLEEDAKDVFEKFQKKYRDFERVLFSLWQADYINERFDVEKIEREKVRNGYVKVRRSLINAVKDVHPNHDEIATTLKNVGEFVNHFSNVFSLNYDLTLYWASIQENSIESNRFNDGFNKMVRYNSKQTTDTFAFDVDDNKLKKANNKTSNVYYPHGNLLIYQTRATKEEKKIAANENALKTITEFWAKNDGNPLFVCEGTSESKLKSISSSKYLSHVYHEELPRGGDNLTIYGWGIGEQDSHILSQLALGSYQNIAVSIRVGDKNNRKLDQEILDIRQKLEVITHQTNIVFFDSASSGCWNHKAV
tara:strand:- start:8216 stop:9268 length:1053 start_codon:yes stop_codon:yes gene_type:complete